MSSSRTSVALVGLSVSILIAPNLRAADTGADPGSTTSTAADADSGVAEVVVTARRLNSARSEIQTQTGASTYTISNDAIAAAPGGENVGMNQVLLQAPDVVQDSFGQLHVRGDHNDLQYRLNGIILPEGISVFSQTLSPRLISSLSLITGALPAEYSLRTAGVIDLTTNSGVLQPGGSVSLYGGSHGTFQPSADYGGSDGNFSYFLSADMLRNDLGIESPAPIRCMTTPPRPTPSAISRTSSIQTIGCLSFWDPPTMRFRFPINADCSQP
jgi:outer membrane receptor for ferrienterochelin and colicins